MDRPYIFCHMLTSLDGKIMGNYMTTPEGERAAREFYDIAFGKRPYYRHQGWLSGRVTTDDNFTFYKKPALDENAPAVPEGDFVARRSDMYYVSVDFSGRLGWKSHVLTYEDTTAEVVEVLGAGASNAYKAFLRRLGISYVIAGEDKLDYGLLLTKLKALFGIETLMLGGGDVLNWSFIQAGYCDEVSILIAPAADGSRDTQTLFMTKEGLTADTAQGFRLMDVKALDSGTVWLRYKPVRPEDGKCEVLS